MNAPHTVEVLRYEPKDPRLGRHVRHDSRSLRFLVRAEDPSTLESVRHESRIPVLDQGNLGSCTGNAAVHVLGSAPFFGTHDLPLGLDGVANEAQAVAIYAEATRLDPWPGEWEPDDTGSDGLAVAKALTARGLIAGYQHATSLEACLTALAERPVMIGTVWRSGMFEPTADGRLRVSGAEQGGHEYCLDELDVKRKRVWMRNSWGPSWGVNGRAWLSWADLGRLLDDLGDVTVLVPKSLPAPVPEPVPPNPVDAALAAALRRLLDNRTAPAYLREPSRAWMADNKL